MDRDFSEMEEIGRGDCSPRKCKRVFIQRRVFMSYHSLGGVVLPLVWLAIKTGPVTVWQGH